MFRGRALVHLHARSEARLLIPHVLTQVEIFRDSKGFRKSCRLASSLGRTREDLHPSSSVEPGSHGATTASKKYMWFLCERAHHLGHMSEAAPPGRPGPVPGRQTLRWHDAGWLRDTLQKRSAPCLQPQPVNRPLGKFVALRS